MFFVRAGGDVSASSRQKLFKILFKIIQNEFFVALLGETAMNYFV